MPRACATHLKTRGTLNACVGGCNAQCSFTVSGHVILAISNAVPRCPMLLAIDPRAPLSHARVGVERMLTWATAVRCKITMGESTLAGWTMFKMGVLGNSRGLVSELGV